MSLEQQMYIVDLHHEKPAAPSQSWFGDDIITNLCRETLYPYGCSAAKETKHILESATFWTIDHIDDVIKGVSNDYHKYEKQHASKVE